MKKPKILLIMPPYNFHFANSKESGFLPVPPFGLALLRDYLKKNGFNPEIKDLDIEIIRNEKALRQMAALDKKINGSRVGSYLKNKKIDSLLEKTAHILLSFINIKKFDIFCFSIAENYCLKYGLIMAKKIKKIKKTAGIVFGGKFVLESLHFPIDGIVNLLVRGTGEEKLLEFCTKYKKSPSKNTEVTTPFKNYALTLNQKPDYDKIMSLYKNIPENYGFHNYTNNLVVPYLYSFGCSWGQCSFCDESFHPKTFFEKSPLEIIEDLKYLKNKYGSPYFAIYNKHINGDAKNFEKLCRLLIKSRLNATISGFLRPAIPLKLIPLMARAGFKVAFTGLESCSNKILKAMKKEPEPRKESYQNLIEKLAENKIFHHPYFMVGFPNETKENFKETFQFVQNNIKNIHAITVQIFSLYNCYIKTHPEQFGIRMRQRSVLTSFTAGNIYPYDEISGNQWEKIVIENHIKRDSLKILFSLYKEIPSGFYRHSPNEILWCMKEYDDPIKTEDKIKDFFETFKKESDFYLKIGGIKLTGYFNPPIEEKWSEEIPYFPKILKIIEKMAKKKEQLILTGEPTLSENLFQIIKYAKKSGFKNITLFTDGTKLANPIYAKKLKESGCNSINFYFLGHKASLHDKITKTRGSFFKLRRGIENWKRINGRFDTKIIFHKLNEPNLYEVIKNGLSQKYQNNKSEEETIDLLGGATTYLKDFAHH